MKFILIALICLLSSCSAILPEFVLPIEEVAQEVALEEIEIVMEETVTKIQTMKRTVQ